MDNNLRDDMLVRIDERTKMLVDWTKAHDTKHARWGIALGAGLILFVVNLLI